MSLTECRKAVTEENWLSSNLRVFEGEATDEYDKLTLVLPLLGLYAQLYATHSPKASQPQALGQTGEVLRRAMSQKAMPPQAIITAATDPKEADASSRPALAVHPQVHERVWRELSEHKQEIFPRRLVIRPRPKPQGRPSSEREGSARDLGSESSRRRRDTVAPHAKPMHGRRFGGRSGVKAGRDGSLTFELFGGLVEAMEQLLDEDTELHGMV